MPEMASPPLTPDARALKSDGVLVAMSGGVDSSIAAKMLLDEGYHVVGVTMMLLDNGSNAMPAEVLDARATCEQLGIEHHAIDLTDTFKHCVIDKFCSEYMRGLTPNPCIDCNKALKFGALEDVRERLGLAFLATGHYAQVIHDEADGLFKVKRAADHGKDQSYVLYSLGQEVLSHLLLPLGSLSKEQVRHDAAAAELASAEKAESQDICFIKDEAPFEFIERYTQRAGEPGPIMDMQGTVLGQHQGIARYTLGQRKGIGVAAAEPLYVIKKDCARNALVVGTAAEAKVSRVYAHEVALAYGDRLPADFRCCAKVSYRQSPQPAVANLSDEDVLEVVFGEPIRVCAPGQAIVLYDGDIVVGGGTIIPAP